MDLIDNPTLLHILEYACTTNKSCEDNWNVTYDLMFVCKQWRDIIQYLISKQRVQAYKNVRLRKKLLNDGILEWHDTYEFKSSLVNNNSRLRIERKLRETGKRIVCTVLTNNYKYYRDYNEDYGHEYEIDYDLQQYHKQWINYPTTSCYIGTGYVFVHQNISECVMPMHGYKYHSNAYDIVGYVYNHIHGNNKCSYTFISFHHFTYFNLTDTNTWEYLYTG